MFYDTANYLHIGIKNIYFIFPGNSSVNEHDKTHLKAPAKFD